MTRNPYWKGILAAIGVFTLWGFSFLAATVGQTYASPLVVLMYRFLIATLVMALPMLLGKVKLQLKGKKIRGLLLLGLCEPVIYFLGEQYGLKYSNSAFSGVMIAVIPIVTLIFACIFLKDRPSRSQWAFSLLCIAGVIGITLLEGGSGQVTLLGVALLILAVFAGSAYSTVSRGISQDFSVYERSFIMLVMGAVAFTVLAILENISHPQTLITPLREAPFWAGVLYLALGASVAGYLLFNYAVSTAPMANVMAFCNLTTVLSVLAGIFLLGEPFHPGSIVALCTILIGIWGVQHFGPERVSRRNKKGVCSELPTQHGQG